MKHLFGGAAALALLAFPVSAQAQLFGNLDNSTLLGGTAGAGLGAVLGSQIAPSGNRTEGAAIGALAGGLLGASYGNSRSTYYGNPYAGQFNPGFNGRNLLGAGIGAGIGGALGSNLAGSGQRQEGTAIGAVLGGLAGYSLANRGQGSRYDGPAYGGPAYGGGYVGGGYGPGYAPGFGPGLNGYGAPGVVPVGGFGPSVVPPAPVFTTPGYSGPSFVPSGQFISGPVVPVTTYSQPQTVITAAPAPITYAAPSVRLAPPVRPTVVRRTIRIEEAPVARAERVYGETAPCPVGTTPQADGSCLENTVVASTSYAAPSYSYSASSGISTTTSSYSSYSAPVETAPCPAGTTKQADGSCMQSSISYGPAYSTPSYSSASSYSSSTYVPSVSIPATEMAPCPAGSTKQADGTCMQSGSSSYSYSASSTTGYSLPDTVAIPSAQYCYPDSDKRYDSLGREIVKSGKHGMHYNGKTMVPCVH